MVTLRSSKTWTKYLTDGRKVIFKLSSHQYFDRIMLNSLIAGGTGSKEGRQACYVSAAHPQESTAVPDRKSWLRQSVHHKWHTGHMCEIDVAKAQEMGLECNHMFSSAVVPLGYASQESLDTIKRSCTQDPQKVAPHAPAIQDYFSALGDRLLDQDQRQERLDLVRCCGNFILQALDRNELEK